MWIQYLFYFSIAFIISLIVIPLIRNLAIKKNLLDLPNERKQHAIPIPSLGGVGIFISFWIAPIVHGYSFFDPSLIGVLAAASLLFAISLIDDLIEIRPLFRILVQIVAASICYFSDINLINLFVYYGFENISPVFQFLATNFLFLLMINAFNLIDGINGLAGSLGLLITVSFSILFYLQGNFAWSLLAFGLVGGVLAFLNYNFKNASIFMGDNGSTFLGLLFTIFALLYMTGESNHSVELSLATVFGIVSIPILDLFRVSFQRIMKKRSPFFADRSHIHHLLLSSGNSHSSATLKILCWQLLTFIITQCMISNYNVLSIGLMVLMIYSIFVIAISISKALSAIKQSEKERRVLSIDFKK